eukprot:CAMPEP_0175039620 /NCGR_PEP_ID=MMETSP0052_2-20121109/705_1 /TAXON_ID=51329 ORGANISM="Polytomella parva, Strain SAG 63-3" /NCGR_SAMPLE_ID=MMETSP0052_2 /ASSEMBLY_ACC=CAM_ASM_000194 /LENGTH=89 /DNA_ID=CAMNT_0016301533 /DNA_START=138 /DNA_END=407 /DNA_ORIENTATION=+
MTAFAKHCSWVHFELLRTLGWTGFAHIDRAATSQIIGLLAMNVFTEEIDIPLEGQLQKALKKCHRTKANDVEQDEVVIDAWVKAQYNMI